MSPSRVRSQPSPRSAHGTWTAHVHPDDAPADPLPFVMRDTSSRPVGCSGLAFRELRLLALRLFKLRRVSVVGGQGGELRRVHALARAHRLPQPSLGSNGLPNFSSGNSDLSPSHRIATRLKGPAKRTCPTSGRRRRPKRQRQMPRRLSTPGASSPTASPTFLMPTAKD